MTQLLRQIYQTHDTVAGGSGGSGVTRKVVVRRNSKRILLAYMTGQTGYCKAKLRKEKMCLKKFFYNLSLKGSIYRK